MHISRWTPHTALEFEEKLKRSQIIKGNIKISTADSYSLALLQQLWRGGPIQKKENKYLQLSRSLVQKFLTGYAEYQAMRSRFEKGQISEDRFRQLYPVNYPSLEGGSKNYDPVEAFTDGINDLTRFARLTLADFDIESLQKIVRHFGIKFPSEESGIYWGCFLAIAALKEGERLAQDGRIIDYTDMIWLPHQWGIYPRGKKDFLLVDECQDASAALIALYKKFAEGGARVIAVGDPRQAIMGFAGASSDSYPLITS